MRNALEFGYRIMNATKSDDMPPDNASALGRDAATLIKHELAACCIDYNALKRSGHLDAQSPLARAIEMLVPSMGFMAQQQAIRLINHYARQAVIARNLDVANTRDVLFCLDCGWTGEREETADDHCPSCRAEGATGRLAPCGPLAFHRMY